jgi:UDPglucose 6-dehydrogenase
LAKVAVIGLGYVGLTTSVGLASLGHSVTGVDIDENRVEALRTGKAPFFEYNLEDLLSAQLDAGALVFKSSFDSLPRDIEFVFLAVPTPALPDGQANLSFLNDALKSLMTSLGTNFTAVIKSTVPVGTCRTIQNSLSDQGIVVVSNPEFLAEGNAVRDFLAPSRIVVGSTNPEIGSQVLDLYKGIDAPRMICSPESAEMIKHASNSFLAVKLSFVNELARFCEVTGADVDEVTQGVGLDPRIGPNFMRPGPGWGGSCFPKDTSELAFSSRKSGTPMATVEAAVVSNQTAISHVLDLLRGQLDGELAGKKIALWGIAFKAGTDDTRDSPSLEVARRIMKEGATVSAFDPMAKVPIGLQITQAPSALKACEDSNALVILTEWPEFTEIKPEEVKNALQNPAAILDTRRILDHGRWSKVFSNFKAVGGS